MPSYYQVLLPHSAGLLSAVLPCYSYDDDTRQNILFLLEISFVLVLFLLSWFLFSLTIISTYSRDSQRNQCRSSTFN